MQTIKNIYQTAIILGCSLFMNFAVIGLFIALPVYILLNIIEVEGL